MSRVAVVVTYTSWLLVGLAAGSALHALVPGRCLTPGEGDKRRLIDFVRTKYNLPSTAKIGVADDGVVSGSCFRKLSFASLSGRRFQMELFVSPDLQFLTTDLVHAKPDPKAEEERRRETAESLTRGNPPIRGNDRSHLTVAVFSDFQCPFCAGLAKTLDGLAAAQGDKPRVVYHYFPLSIHRWAKPAAEAAACAQHQSNAAFWSLHDFFFAHQRELSQEKLGEQVSIWAKAMPGLDQAQFQRCVANSLTSGQIEQDIALGKELGVRGTPTIFVNGELAAGSSADEIRTLIR